MLLLLALALQDPLGAEDIEARETAAVDLLRRGESALPDLRIRLADAQDPEVRARLMGIVARIETDVRRKAFGGGNEVGGLRARLVRVETAAEGRLPFRLEVMNVNALSRPYLPLLRLDLSLPERSAGYSTSHGRLTIKRLSGETSGRFRGVWGCGGHPQGAMVPLRPGETRNLDTLLDERLTPGTYEASVTYYAMRLLGTTEDLVSDVVRFEITE